MLTSLRPGQDPVDQNPIELFRLLERRVVRPMPRSVDDRSTLGDWVERFGGVFHGDLSTEKPIWAALCMDEANLVDLIKFGQGNRFSLVHLENENSRVNLPEQFHSFGVPVFFLLGRYDRQVPAVLAERYFHALSAPHKELIWFEQSAQMVSSSLSALSLPLRRASEIANSQESRASSPTFTTCATPT